MVAETNYNSTIREYEAASILVTEASGAVTYSLMPLVVGSDGGKGALAMRIGRSLRVRSDAPGPSRPPHCP